MGCTLLLLLLLAAALRAAAGAAAPPAAAAAAPLPFVDLVMVVPNPWQWPARRRSLFEAFVATQRRAAGAFTAKLIFVMGDDAVPAAATPEDAAARAHPDVAFVTAPGCPDLDGWVPGAWDGERFPVANSSTTCKVLEGIAVATERFAFSYLARVGDDAYFRWDYFLRERAAALPRAGLYLGAINSIQRVFDHLRPVFGNGLFLPYATGQGWVLSQDVARYLGQGYRRTPRLRTAGPEDAAIALHLWPFDVTPLHSGDFHGPRERACSASSLLVHYMSLQMVRWGWGVECGGATPLVSCRQRYKKLTARPLSLSLSLSFSLHGAVGVH
jgi:hypothetical protein